MSISPFTEAGVRHLLRPERPRRSGAQKDGHRELQQHCMTAQIATSVVRPPLGKQFLFGRGELRLSQRTCLVQAQQPFELSGKIDRLARGVSGV